LRDDRCGGSARAPGCYALVYDAAHLAAHPGRLVMRTTVLVKQPDAAEAAALGASRAARADLRIWVKGKSQASLPLARAG
jgi:hypothetical protein